MLLTGKKTQPTFASSNYKINSMKHYVYPLAMLFGFGLVSAQDTIKVSKSALLEKVNANLQLKIAEQQVALANADYNQSKALFLPSISASHTAITTTNPLMAFGSKLNQERLTAADFNPTLLNDPNQIQNYATRIELLQPIINVDGFYQRKAAKIQRDAFALQKERTAQYLQMEVEKAYMQLQMAYKAVEVVEKAKKTTQANLKLIENYYQQGMLQKTDLLAMQVRMNEVENQLILAKSQTKNLSDFIHFLLNEENKGVLKPQEGLQMLALESNTTSISLDRKDFQAMEQATKAYENMHQSSKMNLLPRLNAFGSYELYDTKIFGFGANGYTLGAQLSWNLFDGNKSLAQIQKSKVALEKQRTEQEMYIKQSNLEFAKTQRDLQDAENSIHLTKLALEQSKEALRIRTNRMEQGLEKTSDLLVSETMVAQKELEHIQAVLQYNITKNYLNFLSN